ncbi:hypothetical protein ABZ636_38945 [Streptomyces sp. NPDC007251]|uniref:hypothetical protein n=1 Tax=unclassified Streptomyces TaxID=2593676 RepID=UPI003404954D
MNQVKTTSSDLPQPLRAVGSGLRRLPGAEQVGKAAGGALDWVGAISPRGRRLAVYTGAGVLGITGVVEWPLALTGAAVAWLTQPRPGQIPYEEPAETTGPGIGTAPATAGPSPAPAETTDTERYGPGDKLAPSHFQHDRPGEHTHEQPAKVGDPATTSALKQVAKASAHHTEPDRSSERPPGSQTL